MLTTAPRLVEVGVAAVCDTSAMNGPTEQCKCEFQAAQPVFLLSHSSRTAMHGSGFRCKPCQYRL